MTIQHPPPILVLPMIEPPPRPRRAAELRAVQTPQAVGVVDAGTLGLWIICLTVGVLGLLLRYPVAPMPAVDVPVTATMIHVDLTDDASPPNADVTPISPDNSAPPPAVPPAPTMPSPPPFAAIEIQSPAIAFALPVKGPSRAIDAGRPALTSPQPAASLTHSAASVHHLTFGQGEGVQPKPDYPREAAIAGEEGVVAVRFSVDTRGRVTSAEIVSACRWPLLNQAALRVIRDQWRFAAGERRLYEISIHFQLSEQSQ